MRDFKVGDELEIIAHKYGHQFRIGQIVTIKELEFCEDGVVIRAISDDDSRGWSLSAEEVRKVKKINDNPDWIFEPLKEEK
ncbi:hypothetical protein [Bacillus phage vB_BanS-Thrax1]|nr:hypothetical protein [Bacillus phage vB_BanS-Thrax1]